MSLGALTKVRYALHVVLVVVFLAKWGACTRIAHATPWASTCVHYDFCSAIRVGDTWVTTCTEPEPCE